MKNKVLTYVLLIVVAGIWYRVFFRVKDSILGTDATFSQSTRRQVNMNPILHRDTVLLTANYRDPFGWNPPDTGTTVVNELSKLSTSDQEVVPTAEFIWPQIKYYGWIRKTQSDRPLAIIEIDGVQLMLRKGEEVFDGIFLSKIERDLVVVNYKRHITTIER